MNLEIAAIAMVLSLAFGLALALLRVSKLKPVAIVAGVWVDVWRNLPLIFMILYFALALPADVARPTRTSSPASSPRRCSRVARSPRCAACALQLRGHRRDHARGDPVAGARPG